MWKYGKTDYASDNTKKKMCSGELKLATVLELSQNMCSASFCIPRGVCLVAEGKSSIAQSGYMQKNAATTDFVATLDLND